MSCMSKVSVCTAWHIWSQYKVDLAKYFRVVLMEIFFLSLDSTARQEGEQRGDKLGPRRNFWLLQEPQHPLRTAYSHCSWHWEGQSVTVGPPPLPPPSISPPPRRYTRSHHASSPTTPLISPSTSAPLRTLQELLEKTKNKTNKKKENHYIFIRPAISTVCWAHNWWADFLFYETFTFLIPYGCLIWNVFLTYPHSV